jgi:hypothetical protein
MDENREGSKKKRRYRKRNYRKKCRKKGITK